MMYMYATSSMAVLIEILACEKKSGIEYSRALLSCDKCYIGFHVLWKHFTEFNFM